MRALLLLAILCSGCKRDRARAPEPPEIVEVQVVDRTPEAERVGLDLDALKRRAAKAAQAASGVRVTDGSAASSGTRYKLRVELRTEGAEEPKEKKGLLRAFVTARLAPLGADPGALSFEQDSVAERVYDLGRPIGDAGLPTTAEARASAWRTHVDRAVEDTVKGAGQKLKLSTGDAQALTTAIDGSDEDLRDEAMRIAAERKERATVPSLLKLLKSDDHAVRDRAIGALEEIGDARAVKPLTEVARFRDVSDLPKVLDALAAIGGDEARSYLEFVASGHESPEMRDLAKQAISHLDRRAQRDLSTR